MTNLAYQPIATAIVDALRAGGPDAYGMPPEHAISDGQGNPCRHCLCDIEKGAAMLIVAHRPFDGLQPYAETGPIFLCADDCPAYSHSVPPPILTTRDDYLLKGYTSDQRISYGTGKIVRAADVSNYANHLLERRGIAFVDVRSSRNNCFQLRITRA